MFLCYGIFDPLRGHFWPLIPHFHLPPFFSSPPIFYPPFFVRFYTLGSSVFQLYIHPIFCILGKKSFHTRMLNQCIYSRGEKTEVFFLSFFVSKTFFRFFSMDQRNRKKSRFDDRTKGVRIPLFVICSSFSLSDQDWQNGDFAEKDEKTHCSSRTLLYKNERKWNEPKIFTFGLKKRDFSRFFDFFRFFRTSIWEIGVVFYSPRRWFRGPFSRVSRDHLLQICESGPR